VGRRERCGRESSGCEQIFIVCEMINALHHELSKNAKAADGLVTEMIQTFL